MKLSLREDSYLIYQQYITVNIPELINLFGTLMHSAFD